MEARAPTRPRSPGGGWPAHAWITLSLLPGRDGDQPTTCVACCGTDSPVATRPPGSSARRHHLPEPVGSLWRKGIGWPHTASGAIPKVLARCRLWPAIPPPGRTGVTGWHGRGLLPVWNRACGSVESAPVDRRPRELTASSLSAKVGGLNKRGSDSVPPMRRPTPGMRAATRQWRETAARERGARAGPPESPGDNAAPPPATSGWGEVFGSEPRASWVLALAARKLVTVVTRCWKSYQRRRRRPR